MTPRDPWFSRRPLVLALAAVAALAGFALVRAQSAVAEEKPAVADDEKRAVAAAEKWLALVDAGRYAESWDESASFFRGAVPKQTWIDQLGGVRRPLGAKKARALLSAKRETSLPGAPDGVYVVIQFETGFEHKAKAVETITPMREQDGSFRVSGYFIR